MNLGDPCKYYQAAQTGQLFKAHCINHPHDDNFWITETDCRNCCFPEYAPVARSMRTVRMEIELWLRSSTKNLLEALARVQEITQAINDFQAVIHFLEKTCLESQNKLEAAGIAHCIAFANDELFKLKHNLVTPQLIVKRALADQAHYLKILYPQFCKPEVAH